MIRKVNVNGFRSLREFSMDIEPGLNVLIGPNGAGKTNIILFFDLLSKLVSQPLSRAVGYCGGVGNIFQRTSETEFVDRISASVEGEVFRTNNHYRYRYDFEIEVNNDRDEIYFANQCFYLNSSKKSKVSGRPKKFKPNKIWDLVVATSRDSTGPKTEILRLDGRKFKAGFLNPSYFAPENLSKENQKSELRQLFERADSSKQTILSFFRFNQDYGMRFISADLVGGETFNILPSEAQKSDDAVATPGILPNGSGLAATLYALKKDRQFDPGFQRMPYGFVRPPYRSRPKGGPQILDRIIEQIKLVNNQVLSLKPKMDHRENVVRVVVEVRGENEEVPISLPLTLMSDGTIKWIALLTAISTHYSIFAIEEPENFIHPRLQTEIVDIMRGACGPDKCILLTSHSETLLNATSPEEVVLVKMEEGRTVAGRVLDQELLTKEIQRTGFGLGYYYYSGALVSG